jgi:hypothetical protein
MPPRNIAPQAAISQAEVPPIRRVGEEADACAACRAALRECSARLKRVRRALASELRGLEARASALSSAVADLDRAIAIAGHGTHGGPFDRASPDVVPAALARLTTRADGSWDVQLDGWPTLRLTPLLGALFAVLAEDDGHDAGDALVGFKVNARVLERLSARAPGERGSRPLLSARALAQAVYVLRQQLAGVRLHGEALVQTRRGWGRRIAVRRPTRADAK